MPMSISILVLLHEACGLFQILSPILAEVRHTVDLLKHRQLECLSFAFRIEMAHIGEDVAEFLFMVWAPLCLFFTFNQNDSNGIIDLGNNSRLS